METSSSLFGSNKTITGLIKFVDAWNTEGYGFIEFEISNSTISTVLRQPLNVISHCRTDSFGATRASLEHHQKVCLCALGNFTIQEFGIFQRGFCVDSSSPQISATHGHFTRSYSAKLREAFARSCADGYKTPGS